MDVDSGVNHHITTDAHSLATSQDYNRLERSQWEMVIPFQFLTQDLITGTIRIF
ncbi:hypothetical protein P3S68_002279 [Capsicum galapagoense]